MLPAPDDCPASSNDHNSNDHNSSSGLVLVQSQTLFRIEAQNLFTPPRYAILMMPTYHLNKPHWDAIDRAAIY